jgi:hypothetical protein
MRDAVVRRLVAIIPAVAIAVGLDHGSIVCAEDTLWETITAVQENEALYANLDVLLRCEYEIGDPKMHGMGGGFFNVEDPRPEPGAAASDASERNGPFRFASQFRVGRLVSRRSETFHFVRQEGMLRLDWKGTTTHDDDTERSWQRMLLFDGTATRLSDDAPPGDCHRASAIIKVAAIRPHTLVLRWLDQDKPLSDYLEGRQDREVTYQGKEEVDGLKCRRVRVTHLAGRHRKPTIHTDLWLAEERNYIPVRRLEYKLGWSEELPHADASVDQWRQIGPGVWFPVSAALTVYNTTALKRENTQKLQYREQYTVERVSLEPKHEIAFFREFGAEEPTTEATQ